MPDNTANNKRIAKNTFMLYIRLFLTIGIQLYSVPIILRVLGAEDYGLYNVIGGITALFSFIGSSMTSGIQRFFAYAMGEKDDEKLKRIFNTTVSIYFVISLVALGLLEIGGVWFINHKMVIPEGRLFAAHFVFQFSIFSFLVALISIPYNSIVVAHERMDFFAYVSILSCLLKLLAVILLQFIGFDSLIVYAFLILIVQITERLIYQIYCRTKFFECKKYILSFDKKLTKELLVYSGINTIGSLATLLRNQGLNIIMNLFFGPLLNAAHSIAMQMNGVLTQFVNNLYLASRPQITKLCASNNIEEMWNLTYRTSLFAFYLMMCLDIVVIIELPTILQMWLHDYPDYTVDIARMFMICILVETMTNQLAAVFQAYNKIKKWQLFSNSILLLNVPVIYISLTFSSQNPIVPYYIQTFFSIIYIISIIIIAKVDIGLNVRSYLKNIIFREFIISVLTFIIVWSVVNSLDNNLYRLFITTILSIVVSSIQILLYGFNRSDRILLRSKIINIIKK